MPKSRLRVSQNWQRHFDSPAALMRTSALSADTLAVDEDGRLYLMDSSGTLLLAKQLSWMPSAVALDGEGERLAVISAAGRLMIFDRNGRTAHESRPAWQATSLDFSPEGDMVVFVDGAGKVGVYDFEKGQADMCEAEGPFHYARFTAFGADFFASGIYGQVFFSSRSGRLSWQKEFRCHTRTPAVSASADIILVPSPHYGVIALGRNGTERGLFEVPLGPRAVAVSADGRRIFVVNEKSELIIFDPKGKLFFREPLGGGISAIECDADGRSVTAMTTAGAIERFSIGRVRGDETAYLELGADVIGETPAGPELLWRKKVFGAFGGMRGGQLAVTRGGRHVALLDIEARFRIFDQAGSQVADEPKMPGRQPSVKASRGEDFVVAASSASLLAIDLRTYAQRRLTLRNEWSTHFDVAPKGIFLAVSDFFRGISTFDESLERFEYLETEAEVVGLAVDGMHHVLASLVGDELAFYSERGSMIATAPYPVSSLTALTALGKGFAAAAEGSVSAFDTNGRLSWSVEVPGEVKAISPVPTGIVIATADGNSFVTNAHGTIVAQTIRRAEAQYFATGVGKEVVSVEYRGRLLTARSSESGVLWRREMEDDILAMEISPDGAYAAVLVAADLCLFSTAAAGETPSQRLYLEI